MCAASFAAFVAAAKSRNSSRSRRKAHRFRFPNVGVIPAALVLWVAATLAFAIPAHAQITFPAASPISAGNIIAREQPSVAESTQGTQNFTAETVVLYGASYNLAFITENASYVANWTNVVSGGKTTRLYASGLGDTLEEARYTIFQRDDIGSTFRIAPLIGVSIPTGMDNVNSQAPRDFQPGTGAWGGRGAITLSWQKLYWNFEAEIGYQANAPGAGYQFGNQFFASAGYHFLVWPRDLGTNVQTEVYGSLESNFFDNGRNQFLGHTASTLGGQISPANGQIVPNTGGQLWLIDPGIIYSTPLYALDFTGLLPVLQTYNGHTSRYDYGAELMFRWSFFTSHHW